MAGWDEARRSPNKAEEMQRRVSLTGQMWQMFGPMCKTENIFICVSGHLLYFEKDSRKLLNINCSVCSKCGHCCWVNVTRTLWWNSRSCSQNRQTCVIQSIKHLLPTWFHEPSSTFLIPRPWIIIKRASAFHKNKVITLSRHVVYYTEPSSSSLCK